MLPIPGAGAANGVAWRAETWMKTREPGGNEVVPARCQGKTRDPGENETGGGNQAELQQQDGNHGEEITQAGVTQGVAKGLRNRGDVVDAIVGKGQDRTSAKNEHGADHG